MLAVLLFALAAAGPPSGASSVSVQGAYRLKDLIHYTERVLGRSVLDGVDHGSIGSAEVNVLCAKPLSAEDFEWMVGTVLERAGLEVGWTGNAFLVTGLAQRPTAVEVGCIEATEGTRAIAALLGPDLSVHAGDYDVLQIIGSPEQVQAALQTLHEGLTDDPPKRAVGGVLAEAAPAEPGAMGIVVVHHAEVRLVARTRLEAPAGVLGPQTCTVRMHLDTKGHPVEVGLVDCPPVFWDELQRELLKWRWTPFLLDGNPRAVQFALPVTIPSE